MGETLLKKAFHFTVGDRSVSPERLYKSEGGRSLLDNLIPRSSEKEWGPADSIRTRGVEKKRGIWEEIKRRPMNLGNSVLNKSRKSLGSSTGTAALAKASIWLCVDRSRGGKEKQRT